MGDSSEPTGSLADEIGALELGFFRDFRTSGGGMIHDEAGLRLRRNR